MCDIVTNRVNNPFVGYFTASSDNKNAIKRTTKAPIIHENSDAAPVACDA
ncbi:hypothetical protein FN3523_0004 [Francisella hispaniensis]|uniref:Uncharacterized protein n=1 Tax=Francisella hispaniensis TaxID=622488 RepID=F4BI67_9GAMM|nr:hypothetical protein FN3523_0004 [Francisella hispaniensis]